MGSRNEKKEDLKLQDVQVPLDHRQREKLEAIQRELDATRKAKNELKEVAQQVNHRLNDNEPEVDRDTEGAFIVDEPGVKGASTEVKSSEPVKPVEINVSFPPEGDRQAFNRWAGEQEKDGNLPTILAEAYKNDPNMARRIENYVERQDAKVVIVKEKKKNGLTETYVDSVATNDLRRNEAKKVWGEMLHSMSPDQLGNIVARTGDNELRNLANQRLAQMNPNEVKNESSSDFKMPETEVKKATDVKVTAGESAPKDTPKKAERSKDKKDNSKLYKDIAEAAVQDPRRAEELLARLDEANRSRAVKESWDPKEGIIDAEKASTLRQKYEMASREEVAKRMSTDQLNLVTSNTNFDADFRNIAGQRLAKLNSMEQMDENIA